jgi:hypothetical protein
LRHADRTLSTALALHLWRCLGATGGHLVQPWSYRPGRQLGLALPAAVWPGL